MPTHDLPPGRRTGGMAGGSLLALSMIAGVVIGTVGFGQPSIGFLVGLGIGVALCLLVWLIAR